LSARGGAIEEAGEPELSAQLAAAVRAADAADADDLTHGFHTYPARMHPVLARELIRVFTAPGDLVLDPFCGSGTVLVEALVAGCKPQGVDLNPLALRISAVHCELRASGCRARFMRAVSALRLASEERVQAREKPEHVIDRLPREVRSAYDPHVMLELAGLLEEIERVEHDADRRALELLFSSLLVKFSRRRADTSPHETQKRIRKGLVSEFFERKGRELVQRWEALYDTAHDGGGEPYPARLVCGDARELPALLGSRFHADLVLTSPPYGGTYDYAEQHALRSAWFGLDTTHFEADEIGSRRRLAKAARGRAIWDEELRDVLRSLRPVVKPRARVLLWLGDAELAGRRLAADEQLQRLAPEAGFRLLATASQLRIDPRGGSPRGERLLLLHPRTP
jgi:hypothetical protein